ncbi:hypothetical protein BZG36_04703 [Bifiguratus adelaidae]|uniref:F-box domain-containing protein n=1 Tax=Bifiguratus adelaidae TaxID=1938954 RepID=A0A261XWW8_9FUNG|nr:hypothetical protein BZG36_04703 [Bifiguratus adelaidae]
MLQLPPELVLHVFSHVDVISTFAFLDTCRAHRQLLLGIPEIWRTIVFDPSLDASVSDIYAVLRRFRSSNGLEELITCVVMDGMDQHFLSLIVMLVKFKKLRILSARDLRNSLNIEADTKVLRELLNCGTIEAKSLALRQLYIYHDYLTDRQNIRPLINVLGLVAKHSVQLDVRECGAPTTYGHLCRHLIRCLPSLPQCTCMAYFDRCHRCEPYCKVCGHTRQPPFVKPKNIGGLLGSDRWRLNLDQVGQTLSQEDEVAKEVEDAFRLFEE